MPIELGLKAFYEGDVVQASCRMRKGDRPVTFRWLFNGIDILNTEDTMVNYLGGTGSVLILDPVRAHHQGTYSCSASNDAGVAQVEATVIVNGTLLSVVTFSFGVLVLTSLVCHAKGQHILFSSPCSFTSWHKISQSSTITHHQIVLIKVLDVT